MITRLHRPNIENMVLNESTENPISPGHIGQLTGSYCERVINTQEKLLVPNALGNPEWDHNPDVKFNLIAYLGFPLNYPDGTPFGTICILDKKENKFSKAHEKKLIMLKEKIETDLKTLISIKLTK